MYTDDLVVFSSSSAGLQQLSNICTEYGVQYDYFLLIKWTKIIYIDYVSFLRRQILLQESLASVQSQ